MLRTTSRFGLIDKARITQDRVIRTQRDMSGSTKSTWVSCPPPPGSIFAAADSRTDSAAWRTRRRHTARRGYTGEWCWGRSSRPAECSPWLGGPCSGWSACGPAGSVSAAMLAGALWAGRAFSAARSLLSAACDAAPHTSQNNKLAPVGERCIAISLSVCLSASIPLEPLDRSSHFVRRSPVAVARSSSGGVAIRYVLPVLLTTLRLAVVGRMAVRGRLDL